MPDHPPLPKPAVHTFLHPSPALSAELLSVLVPLTVMCHDFALELQYLISDGGADFLISRTERLSW